MTGLVPKSVPTTYWHATDDGRIQCDVCPRACKLKEGQRGLCFVRACENQQIVLTTYGRSSGFCIDPVEKNHSIIFYRARQYFRLAPLVVILLVNFARTGT